ncbi:MAG TPA: bifunctional oligoribonuclease/PAP phosphatase NrnA [Bacteroidales bacterium]|nr:bifunctional oligoribonuclease/PAP phosphatase NrnA [Bacteroidales bacterium]
MNLFKYTKQLSKLFVECNNIILIGHINPDGDAVGSQIALYQYLKSKGKSVEMLTPNYLQEFLKWMEGSDLIRVFIKEKNKCINLINRADLIVMLDFNQSNRMGEAEEHVVKSHAKKVLIDHHLNPAEIADLTISEPSLCSTSELLHRLISELNGSPYIDRVYAEALYTGIITDTGNFEHGSYTPDTMRIVADLLETGLDKARILDLIYNNFSADRMRLMGFALNQRMIVLPELKSAYIYLSKSDLKEYNHVKGDTEGFVNMPLSIKGIVFSTMFIEKDGFIKLSFRSKGNFPSNEIASRYFNGGGHKNASGGEYSDTLDNTIQFFLNVLNENSWMFDNI